VLGPRQALPQIVVRGELSLRNWHRSAAMKLQHDVSRRTINPPHLEPRVIEVLQLWPLAPSRWRLQHAANAAGIDFQRGMGDPATEPAGKPVQQRVVRREIPAQENLDQRIKLDEPRVTCRLRSAMEPE